MTEPKPARRRFRVTIRVTVVTIFVLATVLTAVLAVGLQYHFSSTTATQHAVTRFYDLADATSQFLAKADDKAVEITRILASHPGLITGQGVNPQVRELFAAMIHNSRMLYAIYVGLDNGDFFEVINLECSEAVRKELKAAPSDRWAVISIRGDGEARRRTLEFYDPEFRLRTALTEASDYDPTKRPWFLQAQAGKVHKTAPYLFHVIQAPGRTYSSRIAGGVAAVDIALSSVSDYLATRKSEDFGDIFLYRHTGELIASNRVANQSPAISPAKPLALSDQERALVASQKVLKVSNEMDWAPLDFSTSGQPRGYSIDYLQLIAQMTGLRFEYVNGFSWTDLVALFKAGDIDILQSIFDTGEKRYPGSFSDPYLHLPYALVTRSGHKKISHIREMEGATIAVPEGWSIIAVLQREYPGITVKAVASTHAVFEAVSAGQADAGLDVGEVLHYTGNKFFFTNLQYHDDIDFAPLAFPDKLHLLIAERKAALLPIFNRAIAQVTDAQKAALAKKWFHNGAQRQEMLTVPYVQLLELASQPARQRQLIATKIAGKDSYIFVTPFGDQGSGADLFGIVIPARQVLRPALDEMRSSVLLTAVFLLVLIPAPWIFASPIVAPIKMLALANDKIRKRQYDQVEIPGSYIEEIDNLGHSISAMVAAIRQHEAKQMALMDAFIQLIAQAIDDKSPYTGGHCKRVPELAFMLAAKAEAAKTPPFRDFAFRSAEEWREFRVAAWLHDCGKITTPEHIVDKGSKLELIYNRIHEVRTRFEVLWRDAEIRYWRQTAEDPADESKHRAGLEASQRDLQEQFAFVANMNVGGEFLSEDKKLRLQEIARTTWTRHFSDRLGLSPAEETRITTEEAPLPCEEFLLADKREHIIPHHQPIHYDPRLGIKVRVPEHFCNQGELYNLGIDRGTLTAEDRFKINEHIISTIRMLDALPFPDELARVPRYASTHHETMKGTGYPRQLSAQDLSIPERIMVLADIFEALTAGDRPYKKAKPVSVAIDILAKMVDDEHVDRDVFELFLTSGVYREYAQRYLPPAQMDEVDVAKYLKA